MDINKYKRTLRGIALVAAIFGMLISIMVIVNYFQLNRVDPVNTEIINQLVERLQENPQDEELRQGIREMDLLARKAYFTNRWQLRTGAYLILLSLGIFVFIYQLLSLNVRQQVMINEDAPRDILGIQKNARIGIAIVGGILVIAALILTFLTQKRLNESQIFTSDKVVLSNDSIDDSNQQIERKESPVINDSIQLEETPAAETDTLLLAELPDNEDADLPVENDEEQKNDNLVQFNIPSESKLKRNAPTFRAHNANGIVFQTGFPIKWDGTSGENIAWKSPIPVNAYNSPIVWGGRVFISGANDNVREVYCYSASNGTLWWKTKIENIPGSPENPPKTTPDTGLGAATMTTDGNHVYAIFGTGDLVALDMDGKIVWAKNLGVPQNHYGHSSSLIMYKDILLVQYDEKKDARLLGLDARNGNEVWRTARSEKVSWASPVLVKHKGQDQLILVADPTVASYDPATGKQLWSVECMSGEVGPSICYDNGIVYAVNDYATVAAIDLDNPTKILWENPDILSDIPSPLAANGLLIMPTSYGLLACLDGRSGEILWEHEYDDNVFSSPILVGENVYLMDTKGIMHVFKLTGEAYIPVADSPLGEDAVTTPAFSNGRIFIRGSKNLYCIKENQE